MQVCLCVLQKRAGGGIGGRAQRLPPKQNDKTYFHQAMLHAKTQHLPKNGMTIPIFTSNATCKNLAPPPNQNDNIYFHKQGYKQKTSVYVSI